MEKSSLIPTTTPQPLPSARRLFADAFVFYKTHISLIAAIGAVPVVFSFLGVLTINVAVWLGVLFGILSFVAGIFAWLALFDVMRAGGNPEGGVWGAYARTKSMIAPYVWVMLLQGLAVAGGFFLFIIPGIIFSILLGQAIYAYVFEGKKGMDALVASWFYIRGNWWGVFGRILFLGIIFFLASIVLFAVAGFGLTGGGPIFTMQPGGQNLMMSVQAARFMQVLSDVLTNMFLLPFSIIYLSLLYRALRGAKSGAVLSEEENAKMRKTLKALIVIAIAGLIILVIAFGFFFAWLIQYLLDPNADLPYGKDFLGPGFSAGIGLNPLFNFFR